MALYWPEEKVALDIVDDPYRTPFEGDDSYTVLRVTCADLCDYDSYHKVMERLCELLGKEMPTMPGWEEKSRALHSVLYREAEEELLSEASYPFPDFFEDNSLSNVEIIAPSKEEGERMRAAARCAGQYVRGVSVWDGPIPKGSYEPISETTRMSTPEFFFFRKANQLSFVEAVSLGVELCGKYRTVLTQYDRGGGYDFLRQPRTTKAAIRDYLRDVRRTKEGKRAKRVLRHVQNECSSPMSCYLYLLLCLPRSEGSYGIERVQGWGAYKGEHGFYPSASGDYLIYDLFWPAKRVAVQYTGSGRPSKRDFEALQNGDIKVVCVTDDDVADPKRFDVVAHKVAGLLNTELPEPTDKWRRACKRLRSVVQPPSFDNMRLTMSEISEHYVA